MACSCLVCRARDPYYDMDTRDIVAEDLRGNVRITSPDDFINKILRPGPEVESIAKKVMKLLYSERSRRWVDYPGPHHEENVAYVPTFNIVNAVHAACTTPSVDSVRGEWLDTQSLTPTEIEPQPGLVFVSRPKDVAYLQKMITEDENRAEQLSRIWWLQVHTFIEVKRQPESPDEFCENIKQICVYIRRIFREQLDRRFIVALLLCGDDLTMWFCDRSGLIGTVVPVNIHDEPIKFVQVLSSFSLLPAHRIGWDPTMLVYQPCGEHLPSYRIPMNPCSNEFEPSTYHINWVIQMATPGGLCDFLTVRAVRETLSERIVSRATNVWEVVKLRDFEDATGLLDDLEVFVLKQSWQCVEKAVHCSISVKEAELYQKSKLDGFYSAELVKVCNEYDTTINIRNGISLTTYYEATGDSATDTKVAKMRNEDDRLLTPVKSSSEVSNKHELLFEADSSDVDIRAHIRLLLRVTGAPIRFFADRVEFVQMFLDCVKDHEKMYKNGVLHRDVSIWNMLIRIERSSAASAQDETRQKVGQLIDLDHAKQVEIGDRFSLYAYSGPTDDDVRKLRASLGFVAERSIVDRAWRYFGVPDDVEDYLRRLVRFMPQSLRPSNWDEEKYLSMEDVGWPRDEDATRNLFDFSVHQCKGYHRKGTAPFMAAEVLSGHLLNYEYFAPECLPVGRRRYFHDAVHDSESLLYVLTYSCLTRGDPVEGREGPIPDVVHKLFYSRNAIGGTNYILNPKGLEEDILPHFDPYFAPLRTLVLRWFWTLSNAYKYRAIEYHEIHNIVKNLLQGTLDELRKTQSPQDKEKSKAQKEKRHREWVARRKFPKKRTIAQDPATSASDPQRGQGPRTWPPEAARYSDITSAPQGENAPRPSPRKVQQAVTHGRLASDSDQRNGQQSSGRLTRSLTCNEVTPAVPDESATRGQRPQKRRRRG